MKYCFFLLLFGQMLAQAGHSRAGVASCPRTGTVLISDDGVTTVSDISAILIDGFEEVPAKITANKMAIKIRIHRDEFFFTMDFTADVGFQLPFREDFDFIKRNSQATTDAQGEIVTCNNHPVWLNKTCYSAGVNVSDRYREPLAGARFLNAFDWLVDFRHRKIYFRKNEHPIDSANRYILQYAAGVKAGRLCIVSRNQSMRDWPVGTVIVSVNKTAITADNITGYCRLLNETDDWRQLEIEVGP